MITLSKELTEAIFNYLISKPFAEVAHLVIPFQKEASPQFQALAEQAPSEAVINTPSDTSNT